MSELIAHIESFLGPIHGGWNSIPCLENTYVQIAQYASAEKGVQMTISTLGLSRHSLRSASSGEMIHQELFFFSNRPHLPRNLPSILAQIAAASIASKQAILRGNILGPQGRLLADSDKEAVFATLPILLPPEFASARDDQGRGIALAWLLPLTKAEANWALTHGWEALEEELDRQTPEVLDWYRPEMVLP